jgi:DNA invertase Pin-like site-specific DNA recombinase
MKIGYARVSTLQQELKTQVQALQQADCRKIYSEKFTGTSLERPIFQHVLQQLNSGDTLVVTKLDRFARNTYEAQRIIHTLFKRSIAIEILNMGVIENTPTGRLIFNIFSAFAEFERDLIVTRTQEGKAYAKAHNPHYREGRPQRYTQAQLNRALRLTQHYTFAQVAAKTGISRSTLFRAARRQRQLKAEM